MKKVLLSLILGVSMLTSCTDSSMSKITSLGSKHSITLYGADGKVIETWISTGKPHSEKSSDGYYFTDSKTGKLLEVCGTIIIKQL